LTGRGVGVPPTLRKDCSKVSKKREKDTFLSFSQKRPPGQGRRPANSYPWVAEKSVFSLFCSFLLKRLLKSKSFPLKPRKKQKDEKSRKEEKAEGRQPRGDMAQT